MPKSTYHVYVVELSKKIFSEHARFRQANPQFNGVLECLYVGMTSIAPRDRLAQHNLAALSKKGHSLSSSIVKKYGRYLRSSLSQDVDVLHNRADALVAEERLALKLRRAGYAVWYN